MIQFKLDDKEEALAKEWLTCHKDKCPIKYAGAIGGKYTWCFTDTSLGVISSLKCHCGERIVLTDFEDW